MNTMMTKLLAIFPNWKEEKSIVLFTLSWAINLLLLINFLIMFAMVWFFELQF